MNEYDDYLIHFGVKGMKWGVRKDKYKSADKQTRKKMREEYKKTDEYKKKVATAKKAAKVIVGATAAAVGLAGAYTLANSISYQTSGRSLIDNAVRSIDPESRKALRDEHDRKAVGSALSKGNFGDAADAIKGSRVVEDAQKGNLNWGNAGEYASDYMNKYDGIQQYNYLQDLLKKKK